MRALLAVGWLSVAAALSACGSGDETLSSEDAAGPTDAAVLSPTVPAAPRLTPCPDGWREVDDEDGLVTCDPWPAGGPDDCPFDQAHFPGEPGCTTVGALCPPGEFPDDLPADVVIHHVLAGSTGGDGSLAAPFPTVAEAISATAAGDLVILGRGTYDEIVRLRAGIALRGVCPAETLLTSSVAAVNEGVVNAQRDGVVTVADVRIGESARPSLVIGGRAVARIEGVVFYRPMVAGINALGGDLYVIDASFRDPVPRAGTDPGGLGVLSQNGEAALERVEIRNAKTAAFASNNAVLTLDRVAVRDADVAEMGVGGRAVQATGAGELSATSFAVDGVRDLAVVAQNRDMVRLEDVVLRDARGAVDGTLGRALELQNVTAATLSRLRTERQHDAAIVVGGETALDVTDLLVRDTDSRIGEMIRGRAFVLQGGVVARVERARFAHNREGGVVANDEGTSVTLTDVVVVDTRPQACASTTCPDSGLGIALGAFRSATVTATRFRLADSALCGLQIAVDASIDLDDGVVSGAVVGACVQIPDYDLHRLTSRVLYTDNGTNLDTTTLPIPEFD